MNVTKEFNGNPGDVVIFNNADGTTTRAEVISKDGAGNLQLALNSTDSSGQVHGHGTGGVSGNKIFLSHVDDINLGIENGSVTL